MRITQGTFSFLPDLTDEQIEAQLRYALRNGWAIMVEHTDDPHPRNALWEMWGQPHVRPRRGRGRRRACARSRAAREACPHDYVKVVAYDRSLGRQTTALSFIVGRPADEPGFRLERQEKADRRSATRCTRTRPTRRRAPLRGNGRSTATARRRRPGARRAPDAPSRRDDAIEAVLAGSTHELVALAPVKRRIREIAALLVIDRLRARGGPRDRAPVAAHVLHRQPRHRQDDGRAADGGDPPPARLHRAAEGRLGHARRPRRPVRRPHRAEDQARCSSAPAAACCSSTRPTTCTAPRTSATTARRRSRSCCR